MDEPDDDSLPDLFAPWRWRPWTLTWVIFLALLSGGITTWLLIELSVPRPVHRSEPYTELPTQTVTPSAKLADVQGEESDDDYWQYDPDDGRRFKAELIQHIQSANRIVVTEHANFTDFWTRTGTLEAKDIVYGTITLDATQKSRLLATVKAMSDGAMSGGSGCIFEPHHTIAIYNDGSLTSSVRICFLCSQIQWDGTRWIPPRDVCMQIRGFIEFLGFTPSRDWKALAQADQSE
ncbi:MAG: hypothetical protein SH850_17160 [Planctomycetaceae bacterium]|nr:hypothetical protein [Planctomycetaceae bacterium]